VSRHRDRLPSCRYTLGTTVPLLPVALPPLAQHPADRGDDRDDVRGAEALAAPPCFPVTLSNILVSQIAGPTPTRVHRLPPRRSAM
jgi:hypothetical protein